MNSQKITDPKGPTEPSHGKNTTTPAEEIELLSPGSIVMDATSVSNMAPQRADTGKKRPLSLSPQPPQGKGLCDKMIPGPRISPTPAQLSKKRFISTHISDFFSSKSSTGNDPTKGQTQTGHDSREKQPRTESNMAAPMIAKMADVNKAINGPNETTSASSMGPAPMDPIVLTSIDSEVGESILKKRPEVQNLRGYASPGKNNIDEQRSSGKNNVAESTDVSTAHAIKPTTVHASNSPNCAPPNNEKSPSSFKTVIPDKHRSDGRNLRARPPSSIDRSNFTVCCSSCCKPQIKPPPPKSTQPKPVKSPARGRGRPRKIQQSPPPTSPTSPAPIPQKSPVTSSPKTTSILDRNDPTPTPSSTSTRNKLPRPTSSLSQPRFDTKQKAAASNAVKPPPSTPSTHPPIATEETSHHTQQPSEPQPTSQQMNIYDLLLEIKGKQDTSDVKFETVIENKMKDLKSSIGVQVNGIKRNTENNAKLVSEVNNAYSALSNKTNALECELSHQKKCINEFDDKIVTLEDRSNVLEDDFLQLKYTTNQTNLALTDMVSNVEHELVSHLETIKLNVEKEIHHTKQNQIQAENRLSDFTKEIHCQTAEMKSKMQELKSDFENLKSLNERSVNVPPKPLASGHSTGSCSSFPYQPIHHENSLNTSHQENNPELDSDPLYMYGDTTRTLILDGINENPNENLGEISIRCMNDIGIPLNWDDIENVIRIGKTNKNRKWPRPVKLTLKDPSVRDQILYFKSRFSLSPRFKSVRVHKEERKDYRIRTAKLRQAGMAAERLGHVVEFKPGHISIDGCNYSTHSLQEIPAKFMEKVNEIRTPPVNEAILSKELKCRTNSGRAIMVGPSLQKTPFGLAFYSIKSFLSNFYRCEIKFRGRTYSCLEQAYQCTKALLNDDSAFDRIFRSNSPAQMKKWGSLITVNEHWENHKLQIMEDLLLCKFEQNKQLYYSLLNTRPHFLIESTVDHFWGAGCQMGSIALEEGCWDGQNHLGNLLIRVRNYFVRKLEIGQKAIC